MIKGITVTLYERTAIGEDALNNTIYRETPVDVENVLVEPLDTNDIISAEALYGKIAKYRLCLPKGDAHNWNDCRVDFMGESWRCFGFPIEYIEANVPLSWNKKVLVERYG